jgi:hypothetical protein
VKEEKAEKTVKKAAVKEAPKEKKAAPAKATAKKKEAPELFAEEGAKE